MENVTSTRPEFTVLTPTRPDFTVLRPPADEELVNAVTHGIGLAMAAVGSLVMMVDVTSLGNVQLSVGCAAYLFTLVAVYAMSTVSHSVAEPKRRTLFRQLDQAFIFLLIVGTYTPYSIAYLHGILWTLVLAVMWFVAITGFASKAFFAHRIENGSALPYLFLGWMSIIALPTIWHAAPAGVFALIIGGGVCYMVGCVFLLNDVRFRHFHAAWHLWVMGGSTCHFMGLLLFVVRP
jgi:hemolysin III